MDAGGATPRTSLRRPRRLPRGGTIGIAAPAGAVDAERLAAGEASLRKAGFATRRRDDLLDRHGYLAGDDARRAAELMELVEDPSIDAIFCARGGYGSHRIMTRLDATRVRAAAKPLVGYSDVTTLLLWQQRRAGLVGFHGPMLERDGGMDPAGLDALVGVLTGTMTTPPPLEGSSGFGARVEGTLVGGNLTTLLASLGTPWEIDTRGAILVFEEVGERPYRIDRMLQQLLAAGKLEGVVGIGVGHLVDCEPARPDSPSALDVILELAQGLGLPIVTGLPTGHAAPNLPWPVGVRGVLDGAHARLAVLDSCIDSNPGT
jgi:muramoyltetrapeptide carboxypeptidase